MLKVTGCRNIRKGSAQRYWLGADRKKKTSCPVSFEMGGLDMTARSRGANVGTTANNHILTQDLYYNYYYLTPKYLIIGYMDLLGYIMQGSNICTPRLCLKVPQTESPHQMLS